MAEQQAENPEVTNDGFNEGSLSADIAAAMDADTESSEETVDDTIETVAAAPDAEEKAPDATGPSDEAESAAATPESEAETPEADAAPSSLPPEAREVWKDTPESMRKAIAKRENDYEQGILKYANNAKRAEAMDAALQPFQQYFATNGNNPPQTVNNLLQTASILQMGAPAQKAQTIAQLINDFGVDIATLDNVLSGAPAAAQPAMDPQIQQQLAPIQQFMAQQQAAQQQAAQQQVADVRGQVAQFAQDPANEFYKDVALDMAQILELDANRPGGEPITMKQAYDRACMMHPQISQIIQARKNAPTAQQQAAAASIGGSPSGPGGGSTTPDSIRGALEESWPVGGRI